MTSDELDFDELFRIISSPQTRERFKALRLATPEDLASTFKPSPADSEKTEAQQISHRHQLFFCKEEKE